MKPRNGQPKLRTNLSLLEDTRRCGRKLATMMGLRGNLSALVEMLVLDAWEHRDQIKTSTRNGFATRKT